MGLRKYVPSGTYNTPPLGRQAMAAWKAGVSAEVLAYTQNSVGGMIYDTKLYLQIPELFAWTITVVLMSLIMELVLNKMIGLVGKKWAYVRKYVKN